MRAVGERSGVSLLNVVVGDGLCVEGGRPSVFVGTEGAVVEGSREGMILGRTCWVVNDGGVDLRVVDSATVAET